MLALQNVVDLVKDDFYNKNTKDKCHELKALYLNPFFEIKNYFVKYFSFMKKKNI